MTDLATGITRMGRKQAERRMTETVTIDAVARSTNETTLLPDDTTTSHYSGAARMKYPSVQPVDREQAAQLPTVQSVEVHIPHGTGASVATGDIVTVTASTADALLVGQKYKISGRPASGQTTARRFPVDLVS